jgi:hypothetical protein
VGKGAFLARFALRTLRRVVRQVFQTQFTLTPALYPFLNDAPGSLTQSFNL